MTVEQVFLPISELSAYNTKWAIKARVTNKAPLRTFAKGGGEGKVFSADLLDAAGGEIRASFFNQAADKFFEMLEKGKCFTFSKGSIRIANKAYNNTNHKYELSFDALAEVHAVGDDSSIEAFKFSFVNIRTIQNKSVPCTVDICGIITSFKPFMSITGKDGQELVKREIVVADDTATSMQVTLWGDRAKQEDKVFENNPVISLKTVQVKEWKETKAGSLVSGGAMIFNQDSPEAKRVQQWWAAGGSKQELLNISLLVGGAGSGDGGKGRNLTSTDLSGIRAASERLSSEAELFSVVVRLTRIQTRKQGEPQPLHYMACQEPNPGATDNRPSNKRVDANGFSAVHNRVVKAAPKVTMRCLFADHGDQAWLTSFHEPSTKLLGMSGDEVKAMEDMANEKGEAGREELESKIKQSYFDKPLNVTVRAKLETYNGEARANVTVVDAKPVSFGEHGRYMLKHINEMLNKEAILGA